MDDIVYEYWAASLQDGYLGKLIEIVERAGGAKALYNMSDEEMEGKLGLTSRMVKHILSCREGVDIEKNYEKMRNDNISYVNYTSDFYPSRLKSIVGRPYGVFVKGSLPDDKKKSVAIIGSRECSEYGRLMAEYLGSRLSALGINIISGMAWGIDGIAQAAALNAGGHSYAVLGCGPDVIYPAKNRSLYQKLIIGGNGVISEYAPGTPAEARRFPPRNRIISGLSDIVIVVEARAKSGTLITVDMAIDQGKTIMVVPGRIMDPLSVGCLKLIKEGAIPITCIEDVLTELGLNDEKGGSVSVDKSDYDEIKISKEEALVLKFITIDPISVESLADKTKLLLEQVLVILTELERKGLIRELSEFCFIRNLKL